MALKIKIQTDSKQGFKAAKAFVYLDFFLLTEISYVNMYYYESQAAYQQGKESFIPAGLPTQMGLNITNQDFWGTSLMTTLHNEIIKELEKTVGKGNVEIISNPK